MSWLRRIVVAAALVAFGTAVVLAQAPELLESVLDPAELEETIGTDGQHAIVAICGAFALIIALWKGVSASRTQPAALSVTDDSDDDELAGATFDEAIEMATDGGWVDERERARERVHERLSTAAAERIATADGVDLEGARERVSSGEWTDERVVTGFLGDENAPDAPLSWRLYEWLYEDRAYRRAVERTVEEIEAYESDRR